MNLLKTFLILLSPVPTIYHATRSVRGNWKIVGTTEDLFCYFPLIYRVGMVVYAASTCITKNYTLGCLDENGFSMDVVSFPNKK